MAAVAELIRTEADGKISFGNHLLQEKSKKEGFEAGGDEYKAQRTRRSHSVWRKIRNMM